MYTMLCIARRTTIYTHDIRTFKYIYLFARTAGAEHANSPARRQCCLRRLWRTSIHGDPTTLAEHSPRETRDQTVVVVVLAVFSGSRAPARSRHSLRRRQSCMRARCRRGLVARAFFLRSNRRDCDNNKNNHIDIVVTVPEPDRRQDVGKWPSCTYYFVIFCIYLYLLYAPI